MRDRWHGIVVDLRQVVCVAIGVITALNSAQAQLPEDSTGRVTFRVLPETVTVGQPFVVSMRAIPPRGRQAVAPAVPDTGGLVEPLDPAYVTRRGDTLAVRYRLLAWQPGVLSIPFAPVIMRRDASEIQVPIDVRVVVASVLPADSSDRVPKAPREPFPATTRWWEDWWQWLAGALLAVSVLYLLYRWRTRPPKVAEMRESPIERAEASFARLDARALPAAGESGRHIALAAEIIRQYLADIEPSLHLSLTNDELLQAVRPVAGIPDRQLAQLLHDVDAARFSGASVDAAHARRVGGVARELVREIERVRSAMLPEAA